MKLSKQKRDTLPQGSLKKCPKSDILPGNAQKQEQREAVDANEQKISDWLKRVRFRKKLFGGVDEQDVWKKLEELNSIYESALEAERLRSDTLIEEYKQLALAGIERYCTTVNQPEIVGPSTPQPGSLSGE